MHDSAEDWRRESAKMGRVYANGYCNLSATASWDGYGGLLGSRERNAVRLVQLMIPAPPRCMKGQYYAYNTQMFGVNDAPLNRRA
jgi:hypothetical protein